MSSFKFFFSIFLENFLDSKEKKKEVERDAIKNQYIAKYNKTQ